MGKLRISCVVAFLCVLIVASNALAVNLTVGYKGNIAPGATVDIPITVDDGSSIAGASFTVTYPAGLTLEKVTSSFFDTFANQWNSLSPVPDPLPPTSVDVDGTTYTQPLIYQPANGGMAIAAARVKAGLNQQTTMFLLQFKVSSSAQVGIYPISIIQTVLNNTSAGYSAGGEAIPILVGSNNGTYPVLPVTLNPGGITVVSGFVDTDNDGIDDNWEINHFGNLTTANATSDYDKDGYSDLQEYLNWKNGLKDPNSQPYDPKVKNAPGGDGYIPPAPYTGPKNKLLWTRVDGSASLWTLDENNQFVDKKDYGPFATWNATSYFKLNDGTGRILWSNTSGEAALWTVDTNDNYVSHKLYGPFDGWNATSYFRLDDGTARMLWTHLDGRAALWTLDANENYVSALIYGPYNGWRATSYFKLNNGTGRILWTSNSNEAALWTVDTNDNYVSHKMYGPFDGWNATSYLKMSDGKGRMLWSHIIGQAAIWSLDAGDDYLGHTILDNQGWKATGYEVQGTVAASAALLWTKPGEGSASLWRLDGSDGYLSETNYGPFAGWRATSVTKLQDGTKRMLWSNTDGSAALWKMDENDQYLEHKLYGPYAGWSAESYFKLKDGTGRMLWSNADGTGALWRIDANDDYVGHVLYGPFTGWRATSYFKLDDGTGRMLWTHSDGSAALWTVDTDDQYISHKMYGPYPDWSAESYFRMTDGTGRMLWTKTDGTAALWTLDTNDDYVNHIFFDNSGYQATSYEK